MKKDLMELVFILDKSGSMGGLENDTIDGFNTMLAKQKTIDGECYVTTVLFDNQYQLLHDRINIRAVKPITKEDYFVGGSTALLDAIGRTISKIGNAQRNTAEQYRAEKVMFVIITDGEENSSREYTSQQVKHQIERQKSQYGWEFIFLGANIDATQTAASFGINSNRAQSYHADDKGVEVNFKVMNDAVTCMRRTSEIPDDWNKQIDSDFKKRKRKQD